MRSGLLLLFTNLYSISLNYCITLPYPCQFARIPENLFNFFWLNMRYFIKTAEKSQVFFWSPL
ncbi:hypothetical protein SB48_HM08orf02365 [Heyndrickxia coagulans]|uniref:Uncharacterized protein n=1 Tax=Heyndrickxia coagulans TaxID=1398 RepID=A0AAN0T3X1_HEYCO|nr:hypothetical protein SB48_HM08orf02365 [Heyndrickxia coagulans]